MLHLMIKELLKENNCKLQFITYIIFQTKACPITVIFIECPHMSLSFSIWKKRLILTYIEKKANMY